MLRFAVVVLIALCTSCGASPEPEVGDSSERVYPYLHVDVFTSEPLTGNQLAVFLMPEGLTDVEMQDIARELNFSETTFVFPAESEDTDFRVRIFARNREMRFAGHPTIGTAYVLAREGLVPPGTERIVLGEGIGPIPVELQWEGDALRFAWMHQLEPEFGKTVEDASGIAGALGLEPDDVVSSLPIQEVSCGSTFLFVPLRTRAAVDRAVVDRGAALEVLEAAAVPPRGLFLFSSETADDDATVYSRMLSLSGFEDPATGSASGPLGAYLVEHGIVPPESAASILSRQGVAMHRPSRVHVDIGLEEGVMRTVRVGGETVLVGRGTIRLP